jgi:hypothetical protein
VRKDAAVFQEGHQENQPPIGPFYPAFSGDEIPYDPLQERHPWEWAHLEKTGSFSGEKDRVLLVPKFGSKRAGLRDLGWIEGRNLLIEYRWAEGNYDRLPVWAEELLRLNIDVLVTHGAAGALAAKKATSTALS